VAHLLGCILANNLAHITPDRVNLGAEQVVPQLVIVSPDFVRVQSRSDIIGNPSINQIKPVIQVRLDGATALVIVLT
jgi:hypothetical protein